MIVHISPQQRKERFETPVSDHLALWHLPLYHSRFQFRQHLLPRVLLNRPLILAVRGQVRYDPGREVTDIDVLRFQQDEQFLDERVQHQTVPQRLHLGYVIQQTQDFRLDGVVVSERLQHGEKEGRAALFEEDGTGGGAFVRQIPEGTQRELQSDVGQLHIDPTLHHGE